MKTTNYFLKETAILKSHLTRFQRMLSQNLKTSADPFTDEEAFIFSTVALAKYLNCSVSTVERLIQKGLLKKHRHGSHVFYIVSEVLKAIAENERVASYLTRTPKPKKAPLPKIRYRCLLLPDECMLVDLRYRGWKAAVVCHPELWGEIEQIHNMLRRIVTIHFLLKMRIK